MTDFQDAYAGPIDFLPRHNHPAVTPEVQRERQATLLSIMAEELYGPVPRPPDSIRVSRQPIEGEQAERLLIELLVGESRFTVDAALWLPSDTVGPAPLICGLDFVGPVGLMYSSGFPIDPHARISSRPEYGAQDNRIEETLRGTSTYRWPVELLLNRGYAVLVSCYGSWVPDDPCEYKAHGLYPLLDKLQSTPIAAISLWAWALLRLLDAADTCQEIDMSRAYVAGHSRLGKTALWAAANDSRIAAVFANNAGCGGSAPAAHPVGETLAQMAERFPHWTINHPAGATPRLSFDQHQLLSLIAPRAVYLAAAKSDLWSDPIGSYLALQSVADYWKPDKGLDWNWPSPQAIWNSCEQLCFGALGFHLRPGGHDLLPHDWLKFLKFLDEQQC